MKQIHLTRGHVAVVDDEDYEWLNKHKWWAGPDAKPYALRHGSYDHEAKKKVAISMHREILGASESEQVDHINGNYLDNRRSNLRLCSNQQNGFNRKLNRNNSTGYKGVQYSEQRNHFTSVIRYNYKLIYLGSYQTPQEAARAYDDKARELFGEYARFNNV